MKLGENYSLIVDFFISDNEYSVMLADFSSGEIIEGTEKQNLDLLEMIEEVEEKKNRFFIAQMENYVFDINENQVYDKVIEI